MSDYNLASHLGSTSRNSTIDPSYSPGRQRHDTPRMTASSSFNDLSLSASNGSSLRPVPMVNYSVDTNANHEDRSRSKMVPIVSGGSPKVSRRFVDNQEKSATMDGKRGDKFQRASNIISESKTRGFTIGRQRSRESMHSDDEQPHTRIRLEDALLLKGHNVSMYHTIVTLDLQGCYLSGGNFALLPNIQSLNLRNTDFDSTAWLSSNMHSMRALQNLDIRNNRLEALQMICDTIQYWPNMSAILITGNPCFLADTPENRTLFIIKTKQLLQRGSQLRNLNGVFVKIDERVRATETLESPYTFEQAEEFRMELILEANPSIKEAKVVELCEYGIRQMGAIPSFSNLRNLNLARNAIKSLKTSNLDQLVNLVNLNLESNLIDNVAESIDYLRTFNRLRTLDLRNNPLPKNYQSAVLSILRSLETLDGEQNKAHLGDQQMRACSYLLKIAKSDRSRVGCNNCVNIDLSNLDLGPDTFVKTLKALSMIPVETLRLSNNPRMSRLNYRLLVIFYAKNLKELDGEKVAFEERANAIRIYSEVSQKAGTDSPNAKDMVLEKMVRESKRSHGDSSIYIGSILSKLEIAVNYVQIFGIIMTTMHDLYEPVFISRLVVFLSFFSAFFQIDFELFKPFIITVTCLAPPLIFAVYKWKINRERWTRMFVANWKPSLFIASMTWIFFMLVLTFLVYATDWDWIEQQNASKEGLYISIALIGMLLLIGIVSIGYSVRNNYKSEVFWYSLMRIKRRIALFVMNACYMPFNKLILQYFRTCSSSLSESALALCLANKPSRGEIKSIKEFPGLWYFLIPLSIFSIGLLPLFFGHLVRKGVRQIYLNYGIKEYSDEIMALKQSKARKVDRGTKKEDLNRITNEIISRREKLKTKYALSIQQHESASTYLFSSYKINFHFWKTFLLSQRLILATILIFVFEMENRILGALIVCSITAVATVAFRPYTDPTEDLLEGLSQLLNAFCIFMGMLLVQNKITQADAWIAEIIYICSFTTFSVTFVATAISTRVRSQILDASTGVSDLPSKVLEVSEHKENTATQNSNTTYNVDEQIGQFMEYHTALYTIDDNAFDEEKDAGNNQ